MIYRRRIYDCQTLLICGFASTCRNPNLTMIAMKSVQLITALAGPDPFCNRAWPMDRHRYMNVRRITGTRTPCAWYDECSTGFDNWSNAIAKALSSAILWSTWCTFRLLPSPSPQCSAAAHIYYYQRLPRSFAYSWRNDECLSIQIIHHTDWWA